MSMSGPIFDPGDQKVIGQGFPAASSRIANRVYLVLMLGLVLLGVGCLLIGEYASGIVMVAAGAVTAFFLLRAQLSERAMLRRMRRRAEQSSVE
jgi:FtsH-binding integral membrane protein